MASDDRTEQFRAIFDAEDIFDRFVKNANSRSGETRLRRDDEPTGQLKNGKRVPIAPPREVPASDPFLAKTPLRLKRPAPLGPDALGPDALRPLGLGPALTVRDERPVPPEAHRSSAQTVVADSDFAAALVAEASPPVPKLRVPPRVPVLSSAPSWDHEVTVKADSASIGLSADEDEGTRPDAPMPANAPAELGDLEIDEDCLTMPRASALARRALPQPPLTTDSGQQVLLLTRVKKSSVIEDVDAAVLDAFDSVEKAFDGDGAEPLDVGALVLEDAPKAAAPISSAELSDVLHELSGELHGVPGEPLGAAPGETPSYETPSYELPDSISEVIDGFGDLSDSLLVGESSVAEMPRIHRRPVLPATQLATDPSAESLPESLAIPSSENMLLHSPSELPAAPRVESVSSLELDSLDLDSLDLDSGELDAFDGAEVDSSELVSAEEFGPARSAGGSSLDVGLSDQASLGASSSADAVMVPELEEQAWQSVVRAPSSVTARLEAARVVPDVAAAGQRDETYVGEGVENGQMPTRQLDQLLSDMAVLLRYGHEGQVRGRLDELRRVYPEDLLLMRRLAEFYVENDRRTLALDPLFSLASALFERRNTEGMRQVLEQVLKLDPDNKRALRLLGLLQHKSG